MHPFSTPWKHQKTLRFSDVFRGRERVHWERELKIIIAEAEDVTSEIDRQLRRIKKIIQNHPLKVLSKFR